MRAQGHEQVVMANDDQTGLRAVIVIDSTAHGPALGGIRLRRYASEPAAMRECQRLARAMTLKNALASTGYGGGKTVIAWHEGIDDREQLFRSLGGFIKELDGRYIPATDVGTDLHDMACLRESGVDVHGGDTDTAVSTATGVHASLCALAAYLRWPDSLAGVGVCVQGAGKVGARLARQLGRDGARVVVSDLDRDRAETVAREAGGCAIDPERVIESDCEVIAPCAMGEWVTEDVAGRLRCKVVAGAANNILATAGAASVLAERGILFVPDFVTSAGGVIQVRAVRDGWSKERLDERLHAIGDTVLGVLERAGAARTPTEAAQAMAIESLGWSTGRIDTHQGEVNEGRPQPAAVPAGSELDVSDL
jgi:leucine dehydrogenase